jgi:hypothetical protein
MGQHALGLAFQKRGRVMIRTLRQLVNGGSFVDCLFGFSRLLLNLLRNCSLELEECHSLWNTYCMNAQ